MLDLSLFPELAPSPTVESELPREARLGQYPTPGWFAEILAEYFLGDLSAGDHVLDPTCGPGPFLSVIPPVIPATGIEIDPRMAEIAVRETGRRVIIGDVTTVDLDFQPSHVLGNPPFNSALIDQILERCHQWLPQGGRAGLILPAYYLGTMPERVLTLAKRWSIRQELIPRVIYQRLSVPLVFAHFEKTRENAVMVGFALYHETAEIRRLENRYRKILSGTGSVWVKAVAEAMRHLGGRARVKEVCAEMERRVRPTPNPHWHAKVRQVLQCHFQRTETGVYEFPAAA